MERGWITEISAMVMPPGRTRRMSPRASTRVLAPEAEMIIEAEIIIIIIIIILYYYYCYLNKHIGKKQGTSAKRLLHITCTFQNENRPP
jgi:hypothetical protein